MICVLLIFYQLAVSQFFVGSLKDTQTSYKDKASFIELDSRGAADNSHFYRDSSSNGSEARVSFHWS